MNFKMFFILALLNIVSSCTIKYEKDFHLGKENSNRKNAREVGDIAR
jgi:hypothetical protein